MSLPGRTSPISITEAASRGVARLVKDAESDSEVMLSRHGRVVAAVISTGQLRELREMQQDVRDAALVIVRAATDTGVRMPLDEAVSALGFDKAQLEAELDADLAAGRP